MRFPDLVILLLYLSGVLLVGIFITHRKKQSVEEFFTANRSMNWFTMGLSVMVTAFSAVNFTGFSGEVFSHGLYVMLSLPVFVLVAIPVNKIIIPHFYKQNYSTAYEYLERRFDKKVRILAAVLFLVWRTFWGATILYIPTKILNLVTGWSIPVIIFIVGVSVMFYTTYGGIRAVMITDAIQFFVLFFGLIVGIVSMSGMVEGGLGEIFRLGARSGLTRPFYPFDASIFSFDPTIRISFWSCTLGTFVAFLARYSSDQMVVQRYFTARSEKDARRGFWLNVVSAIVSLTILAVLGFLIFTHANLNHTLGKFDKPLVYFVNFIKDLPVGVSGLMIAGLIAATMSSIDSGSNSCTRAWIADIFEPLTGKKIDLKSTRLFSILFGFIIVVMSLYVGKLGSIFEIANKIVNGFGSPLLALFLLGKFTPKVPAKVVLYGGIIGAIFSAFTSLFVKNLALHYYAVVNLAGTILIILLIYCVGKIQSYFQKY
ncbi:MAG: sodium/solute symporter [Candidatus Marinimicrobia bacterium]|nr:sodium/solute symporter [Candidatus Neomarinimicrobiota bacterium]